MEAQVQVGELGDGLHDRRRVGQLAQALLDELGADDVVVVERDLRALEPTGGGLADVVQQRRQPVDDVGLVPAVLLQRDRLVDTVSVCW